MLMIFNLLFIADILAQIRATMLQTLQEMKIIHSTVVLKPRSTPPSIVHATPDPLRFAAGFRTPVQCFVITNHNPMRQCRI